MLDNKRPFVQNAIRLSPVLFALIMFGVVFLPIVGASAVVDKTAVSIQRKNSTHLRVPQAGEDITFVQTFLPATIGPGSSAALLYTMTNNGVINAEGLVFTNVLPSGIVIASVPGGLTDCTDGVVNAPAGGDTIVFTDGNLSGNGASCTLTVNVSSSSSASGEYQNITGDLTSSIGNSGTATSILTVNLSLPGFSKSFSPSTVAFGSRSTLTFVIDNGLNASVVGSLDFTDTFPVGMEIADPANASTDCDGGNGVTTLTAVPGSSSVTLNADGFAFPGFESLAAGDSCTVSVDVVATGVGSLENVSDELLADFTSSGKAGAVLEVTVDTLSLIKEFVGDPTPSGGTVFLEFTITNFDRLNDATNITFSDDLGAVLTGLVATDLSQSDVCGAGSALSGTNLITLIGGNIPGGETCTFTVTLAVPSVATVGIYPNVSSSITGDINGSAVIGAPASDSLFVSPTPLFSKTFTDDPVAAGGTATLEFTITNTSLTDNATDISFQDLFDTVLQTAVSTPAPGFCGGGSIATFTPLLNFPGSPVIPATLAISGANLAPGASCTFSITLNVEVDAPSGIYPNITSDMTATVGPDTVTTGGATDDLVIVAGPQLRKEFTDDPVVPGNTVTLSYTLSHAVLAAGEATDIAFTDNLGAALTGLTAVSLPADGFCGAGSQLIGTSVLTFTGGTLTPGATCTFSVTLSVPLAASPGNYPSETSNLTAMVSGLATTGNKVTDTLTVAGVIFTKRFTESPLFAGQTVALEFTLENVHPTDAAMSMFFTDDLDNMLSGLAVTGSLPTTPCGASSVIVGTNNLNFTGGELAVGESCTFTVTVQIPVAAADGSYTNRTSDLLAFIDGSPLFIDPAIARLTIASQYLELSKSFIDDPVYPNNNVVLEFTITNTHPITSATNIAFTDDLEAALTGLTAVSLPVDGFCGAGSQIIGISTLSLSGASLAAGASCTFEVTLLVPGTVSLGTAVTNETSNIAGVTGSGYVMNGGVAIDRLQIGYTIFNKQFESPTVAGGTSVLTFTIQNLDASNAINSMAFSDDLDTVISGMTAIGLPLSDVCGVDSTFSGTSLLTFTGGELAPSSTCMFTVTVQIPSPTAAGVYTNTTSNLTAGGLFTSIPATAALTIDPSADLSISKIDAPDPVIAGETLVYTVTVTNNGPASAQNVVVTDTLPADATLIATTGCAEDSTGVPTCSLGTIADGANAQFVIEAMIDGDAGGVITNTAVIASTTHDPDLTNNQVQISTTVQISVSIYLPIILYNTTANAPDLIVTNLTVSDGFIQVVIENQGNRSVTNAFWVDVYIAPSEVPVSVNQTWQQVGNYGAVWGVEGAALPILPGGTMTLTLADSYYHAAQSQLPLTIAVGTPVYAQVDSARVNSSYGSVNESHEIDGGLYNNILGPLLSD